MADHDAEISPVCDMRQCVCLLAGKDETARFRTRQRRPAVPITDLMTIPLGHQFGRAMQALFGLDHGAGREAILASSVLAESDQIWRATYRAHDLVELIETLTV